VGLELASKMESHAVVTMDPDGEDNPLNIEHLVEEMGQKGLDAVVTKRDKKYDTLGFKIYYFFYKFIFKTLTG
jgi:hypothetical protein